MYMLKVEVQKFLKNITTGKVTKVLGGLLVASSLFILLYIFKDTILANINFYFSKDISTDVVVIVEDSEQEDDTSEEVVFIDKEFGLYIPKINANSVVIKNVSPIIKSEYDSALEKGVAHANGSSLPNLGGNTFLFAHSARNFYESRSYNVYFYLLPKLEKNDDIYVSYKGEVYKYKVTEVKVVSPNEIEYMNNIEGRDTVTLMTCWPAGLNLKRVIVIGDRVND